MPLRRFMHQLYAQRDLHTAGSGESHALYLINELWYDTQFIDTQAEVIDWPFHFGRCTVMALKAHFHSAKEAGLSVCLSVAIASAAVIKVALLSPKWKRPNSETSRRNALFSDQPRHPHRNRTAFTSVFRWKDTSSSRQRHPCHIVVFHTHTLDWNY